MKKRILALLLAAVLVFGLLPTAALAADFPWTGTDGGASGITVDTAPSAVKWALTISPKANGLANDSDVYAVVIPTDVYNTKPSSFLTSINATNYAEASKLGLNAGDHRATTVKYAGGGAIPLPAMTLPSFAVQPATYHKQYTYILFSNRGTGDVKNYYTGTFWVDTEGNTGTRDASYMVRYNGNATSVGSNQSVSGTPGNVITKPESANTALTFSGISRQGYTFLGWDKNSALMGTDPNAAAASDTQPTYVTDSNSSFKPADTSRVANEIQDLYAIWKPVQITIAAQAQAMGELRVGVSFVYTPILGGANGTTKKVSASAEDNNWLIAHGLAIKNNAITGVPTVWTTEGKDITLTATDESNKTTATLVVALPKIEKGLQPQPDTTVTTGLSTTMVDDMDENTNDGRLIGFYAAGQTPQKDSANASMTDGTGTYTEYYLTKGMVYEYRPKTAENDGAWREIPAPEALYGDLSGEPGQGFLASLALGATTRYKTTISGKTTASYAAVTEAGPWTAWDAAYGAIIFDDGGLPVVTGLAKDAEYEVRFRESNTYDPSNAVTIKVGGGSGDGSGPADPSAFVPVTIFDWDDTLITTVLMDKTLTAEEATAYLHTNVVESEAYRDIFMGKQGYIFEDVWLTYGTDVPGRYGRMFAAGVNTFIADYVYNEEEQASFADFTQIASGAALSIKAAYRGSLTAEAEKGTGLSEMPTQSGAARNQYTINAVKFNRFGTSTNYSVTIEAKRETTTGQPVAQAGSPAIRVAVTYESGATGLLLLPLSSSDVATGEAALPSTVSSISCAVVDTYEFSNWVGASFRSASSEVKRDGDNGFLKLGTLGYVNEQLRTNTISAVVVSDLKTLGVSIGSLTIREAAEKLVNAWRQQGGDLTIQQMNDALQVNR